MADRKVLNKAGDIAPLKTSLQLSLAYLRVENVDKKQPVKCLLDSVVKCWIILKTKNAFLK